MNGKHEKPDPGPPCGHCGSTETGPHCQNGRCTWVKCRSCQQVSDTRRTPKPGSQ